jgi:hypothetical protein
VLDELDEFIVELFKKSEAFEAALELYQLEYKGLLIGGARAATLIKEAIREAAHREQKDEQDEEANS